MAVSKQKSVRNREVAVITSLAGASRQIDSIIHVIESQMSATMPTRVAAALGEMKTAAWAAHSLLDEAAQEIEAEDPTGYWMG